MSNGLWCRICGVILQLQIICLHWLRFKARLQKNLYALGCAPARAKIEDTNLEKVNTESVNRNSTIIMNDLNFVFLMEEITSISVRVLEEN